MGKSITFEKSELLDIQTLHKFIDRQFPLLSKGFWELSFGKPNRTLLENQTFWGWIRIIYYFENEDSEFCYPKEHFIGQMKIEKRNEMTVFEAVPIKSNETEYMFCCKVGEAGDNECWKHIRKTWAIMVSDCALYGILVDIQREKIAKGIIK